MKFEDTEENMENASEEMKQSEATQNPEESLQVNPREVLFQVFEQGARACQDWESSQKRIDCLISLQSSETLTLIPDSEKNEILSVLNSLLQSGQLNFGIQQVLYPMVKELEQ